MALSAINLFSETNSNTKVLSLTSTSELSSAVSGQFYTKDQTNALSTSFREGLARTDTYIDGHKVDLSACHISKEDYAKLLKDNSVLSNVLYIVSSDERTNYGMTLQDVADPENETDAANKRYVDSEIGKIDVSQDILDSKTFFIITEDMVSVDTTETSGVAPYSTSYKYTNVTITDPDVKWVENGLYYFVIDTKLVVQSAYRNVRIRMGATGDWKPLMNQSTSILAGSSYFTKAQNRLYVYKTTHQANGAVHVISDNDTTYAYLVNTIAASTMSVDTSGYAPRYALLFPTTPLSSSTERFSAIVASQSTGTTKAAANPASGKFYLDRSLGWYNYTANFAAGAVISAALYQSYQNFDLRYTANTSTTYVSTKQQVFLYLKNYDPEDMSFKSDNSVGVICSRDKLATKFPTSVAGDVYLLFLGWTTATWYQCQPCHDVAHRIFKYTPSTKKLVPFEKGGESVPVESGTKTYVDGVMTDISAFNISKDDYENLVKGGNVLSNAIYIVSSDVQDMYGERVVNVGYPIDDDDAATKSYVDYRVGSGGGSGGGGGVDPSQLTAYLKKTAQTLTDAEKTQVGVNIGTRYALVKKTLANCTYQSTAGLSCQVDDYAVNEITISSAEKPVFIFLPRALDDRARDFVLRIVVTASSSPTIAYVPYGDETTDYDTNDDSWSQVEQGVNIVSFTETSR